VQQCKQLEEKQSELQGMEAVLNEEVCSIMEKLGEFRKNFEKATKEKNTARLKNKEILTKEQNKVLWVCVCMCMFCVLVCVNNEHCSCSRNLDPLVAMHPFIKTLFQVLSFA